MLPRMACPAIPRRTVSTPGRSQKRHADRLEKVQPQKDVDDGKAHHEQHDDPPKGEDRRVELAFLEASGVVDVTDHTQGDPVEDRIDHAQRGNPEGRHHDDDQGRAHDVW